MYRLIDCATWDDPWFADLEPNAKLFFLYLITNRRSTSCGAFEVTVRQMAFETGLAADDINRWLAEWQPRVHWWPEHNIVWLRNFYRHQRISNEKTRINARKVVVELPASVAAEIIMAYPELRNSDDSLSIAYPSGMHQTAATTTASQATAQATAAAPKGDSAASELQEIPGLYAETLNGAMPEACRRFSLIDKQFTEVWFRRELLYAEREVGPLSRSQLGRGLDLTLDQLKRAMDGGKVKSPRPFARRLLVDYLKEQRDEHHAA